MENLKFKITLPTGELRRLRFKTAPTWSEFFDSISSIAFVGKNPHDFIIQYRDEEGDPISICSQPEWTEALDILSKDDIKRISIVSKEQLKEIPLKQPRISVDTVNKPLETTVKEILDKFFVQADSFVTQFPALLEAFVEEVKKIQLPPTNPSNESAQKHDGKEASSAPHEFPFIPNRLHSTFFGFPHHVGGADGQRHCHWKNRHHHRRPEDHHRRPRCPFRLNKLAFRFLEEKNYQAARESFEELLKISPNDYLAAYNLACAHALISAGIEEPILKEETQQNAIKTLRHALSIGYSNVEHMEKDEDFASIRDRPEFQELVRQLKNISEPVQGQTIPVQIQHEESKPQPQPELESEPEPEPIKKQVEDDFVVISGNTDQPKEQPQSEEPATIESDHLVFKQFESELKQLLDMGFLDHNKNLELLLQNQGDVFQVLSVLLN